MALVQWILIVLFSLPAVATAQSTPGPLAGTVFVPGASGIQTGWNGSLLLPPPQAGSPGIAGVAPSAQQQPSLLGTDRPDDGSLGGVVPFAEPNPQANAPELLPQQTAQSPGAAAQEPLPIYVNCDCSHSGETPSNEKLPQENPLANPASPGP